MFVASQHRRVRRLRLACQRDEQARHVHVLLEDALRTASIDDTGRLIIVRRLDLGPISPRATATTLSRQLEHQLANLRSDLVSVHSLSAARAGAVFFSSPEEPWYLVAGRTARGLPCDDWYWPLALPGWNRHQPASETLRQSFRTLAALPDGLRHTLRLASLLNLHHVLPALLQTLTARDLTPLLAHLPSLALRTAPPSLPPRLGVSPSDRIPAACLPLIRTWGANDPRTHWLALYLTTAAISSTANAPPQTVAIPPAEIIAQTLSELLGAALASTPPPQPATPSAPARLTPATHSAPPAQPASDLTASARPAPVETLQSPEKTQPTPFALDRLATAAGGLFFLVPLLQRAQLPAHLATLSEAARQPCAWQIFRLALRHARIPEEDPVFNLFPHVTAPFAPAEEPTAATFLLRAHHQARRLNAPGLRDLIRRPALLSSTPTHIDLFFRPNEADLRLRRAALDVDPGWIRWLTRLISYHYTRED